MARETSLQKSATGRFTQSMATGVRILAGGDVPAYTLTYLNNTSTKRTGDYETIVLPYIKLGRTGACAVRFGDDMETVSREHAAIERQAANVVVIKNLSQTNPTLVNGKKVNNEWYLNNGDIIQLSLEGPKMKFNVSATGTKNMKFTQRLGLIHSQLEAKFKRILGVVAVTFLLITGFLGYKLYKNTEAQQEQEQVIIALTEQRKQDSLAYNSSMATLKNTYDNKIKDITSNINKISIRIPKSSGSGKMVNSDPRANEIKTEDYKNQVYFLQVTNIHLEMGGQTKDIKEGWTGSGFLLGDGKFVTARHCIQAWRYSPDELALLNIVENNGGQVVINFIATSQSGNKISFSYDSKNASNMKYNLNQDKSVEMEDGVIMKVARSGTDTDWAVITDFQFNGTKSDLAVNTSFSKDPKAPADIDYFGFPLGEQVQGNTLKAQYANGKLSQDGYFQNMIRIECIQTAPGSSGCPAYMFNKEKQIYEVIGIHVAATSVEHQHGKLNYAFAVPINKIY